MLTYLKGKLAILLAVDSVHDWESDFIFFFLPDQLVIHIKCLRARLLV